MGSGRRFASYHARSARRAAGEKRSSGTRESLPVLLPSVLIDEAERARASPCPSGEAEEKGAFG